MFFVCSKLSLLILRVCFLSASFAALLKYSIIVLVGAFVVVVVVFVLAVCSSFFSIYKYINLYRQNEYCASNSVLKRILHSLFTFARSKVSCNQLLEINRKLYNNNNNTQQQINAKQ